eukprot:15477985-Alexandrium_andersonii.AAC.1
MRKCRRLRSGRLGPHSPHLGSRALDRSPRYGGPVVLERKQTRGWTACSGNSKSFGRSSIGIGKPALSAQSMRFQQWAQSQN